MDNNNADGSQERGEKGGRERPAIEDGTLEELEKDFQETLQELMGDRSLDKFRAEYEKLHRALRKSHEGERRLMGKCRELNAEIVANSAKVSTALKLTQDDQATIASLKKEIDKAWKLVDAAHEKEVKATETIADLRQEISNLTRLVEQGAGLAADNSMNELLKLKEELTQDRDERLKEIAGLRERMNESTEMERKLEVQLEEANNKLQDLRQDIQVRSNEAQREARKRDKLERELRETRATLELRTGEARGLQTQADKSAAELKRVDTELKECKIVAERQQKDTDQLQTRFQKLQQDFELQLSACEQLNTENQSKTHELKQKEDELTQLRQEMGKVAKVNESVQRKLRTVEEQKREVEDQREVIKGQMQRIEREMEAAKKQAESDKRQVDELTRERDLMSKNMIKASAQTQKQVNLVKLHEQSKSNLEQEIANYRDEAQKQRKLIYELEKERDRYINEASDLTQMVLQNMEDVKVREMKIFDYKKKIAEAETKLKQQQNLYEAVRSDRNLYSKNLIESQDEITEMKRKLKIMSHQIDQLKDEISSKEAALVKEHADCQKVEREREGLKADLKALQTQAEESRAHIKAQEQEQHKLLEIISKAEAEHARQKKELNQVISERDILGTQLVRRNDELALLYEKIKIQQATLHKGELEYAARVDDLRVLKLEIRRQRRERTNMERSVASVDDLRREVYHLQREMLKERTRCKALEEELENPMNVHRWRKLEGSDPSTYEMIQKMQALQKRLITKTEEVVEKELLIQEKEKLYVELKHILARQPGPEVAEQLSIYQATLKDKQRQMKSMASELNMYETQVGEYKYDIERLAKDLQEVKKKYFLQKKKEQQMRDQERGLTHAGPGPIVHSQLRGDQQRFAGAGYSLKPIGSA